MVRFSSGATRTKSRNWATVISTGAAPTEWTAMPTRALLAVTKASVSSRRLIMRKIYAPPHRHRKPGYHLGVGDTDTGAGSARDDRIVDVWGPRTPHPRGTAWPTRVDLHLHDGVTEAEVDRWVQSACLLCSNGCGCDIA